MAEAETPPEKGVIGGDAEEEEDGEEVYEVEKIVGMCQTEDGPLYKVRWLNYEQDWDTWEPPENLDTCKDLIEFYVQKQKQQEKKQKSGPQKSGPQKSGPQKSGPQKSGPQKSSKDSKQKSNSKDKKPNSNDGKAGSKGKDQKAGSKGKDQKKESKEQKTESKDKAIEKEEAKGSLADDIFSAEASESEGGQKNLELSKKEKEEAKKKARSWFVEVSSSDEEADTLKDKFWRNLEQGKIDVFSNDLYSKVKGTGRSSRPQSFKDMYKAKVTTDDSKDESDLASPPHKRRKSSDDKKGKAKKSSSKSSNRIQYDSSSESENAATASTSEPKKNSKPSKKRRDSKDSVTKRRDSKDSVTKRRDSKDSIKDSSNRNQKTKSKSKEPAPSTAVKEIEKVESPKKDSEVIEKEAKTSPEKIETKTSPAKMETYDGGDVVMDNVDYDVSDIVREQMEVMMTETSEVEKSKVDDKEKPAMVSPEKKANKDLAATATPPAEEGAKSNSALRMTFRRNGNGHEITHSSPRNLQPEVKLRRVDEDGNLNTSFTASEPEVKESPPRTKRKIQHTTSSEAKKVKLSNDAAKAEPVEPETDKPVPKLESENTVTSEESLDRKDVKSASPVVEPTSETKAADSDKKELLVDSDKKEVGVVASESMPKLDAMEGKEQEAPKQTTPPTLSPPVLTSQVPPQFEPKSVAQNDSVSATTLDSSDMCSSVLSLSSPTTLNTAASANTVPTVTESVRNVTKRETPLQHTAASTVGESSAPTQSTPSVVSSPITIATTPNNVAITTTNRANVNNTIVISSIVTSTNVTSLDVNSSTALSSMQNTTHFTAPPVSSKGNNIQIPLNNTSNNTGYPSHQQQQQQQQQYLPQQHMQQQQPRRPSATNNNNNNHGEENIVFDLHDLREAGSPSVEKAKLGFKAEDSAVQSELSSAELRFAVRQNDYARVHHTLKRRVYDLEQTDKNGYTLVMVAAQKGFDDLLELLVISGGKVNAELKNGTTPLMIACEMGLPCTVELLLTLGAHVNLVNSNMETAMIKAVKRGHKACVFALLECGCNLAPINGNEHNNPLKYAEALSSSEIYHMLADYKTRITTVFEKQINVTLNDTAQIMCTVFPLQIFNLRESTVFKVHFKHEIQATHPGVGMLLFIAHARASTTEARCRLYGPCAVTAVALNNTKLIPMTEEGQFVMTFCPLLNGDNKLEIFTAKAPNSRSKLIVSAYKAKLIK